MKKIALGLIVSILSIGCFASPQTPQETSFLKKVKSVYPKLEIDDAVYLPTVQLYELHKKGDRRLIYTNENLSFAMTNNEIIDLKNQKNLSKDREAINLNRFLAELPKEKAIQVKFGTGARTVAIFSDPDCPYCKQLDKEIHEKLKNENMTIYYYMNPLNIPGHEMAPMEAKKIWCSPDKSKSWVDWMINGKLPPNSGDCPNPVNDTKEIATSVGFNVTPAIIFDNGYVVKSGVDAKDFLSILNKPPIITGIR